MIISMTGHRPDKLGGYYTPNTVQLAVVDAIKKVFAELKPSCVITGMALGVDQWAAEICAANGIPFVAAIPFHGQESMWPEHAQKRYHALVNKAHQAWIISPGGYEPAKMHIRNHWMVDACNLLLAVYDGSPGGTGKCVQYAEKVGRKIKFLHLPKEIWDLAHQMNPKADKSTQYVPKYALNTMTEEELAKSVISPFINTIKEKAVKKAATLEEEYKALEKAKLDFQVQMMKESAGAKLIQEKMKQEEFGKKVAATYKAMMKKESEKEESAKTVVHSFGRVLDLD